MTEKFELPKIDNVKLPKLAAIHDICGYGKCSLAVVLPVVSLAGVDVLPIPTSVVSVQTTLQPFALLDTTDFLPEFLDTWEANEIDVEGIYTGFLGSSEQIEIILNYFKAQPDAYRIVDPVMGDHGSPYPTYTDEMCNEMKHLVPYADVLTPNITEASILIDKDYPGQEIDREVAEEIIDDLLDMGAKAVVLKGIKREKQVINIVKGRGLDYTEIPNDWNETSLHGTGDLFASCITAGLFSGHTLEESVAFAGKFVYDSIVYSKSLPGHLERGVNFEGLLKEVVDFCNE